MVISDCLLVGVYSKDMETITQEQGPSLSIVEKQKEEASRFVAERIGEIKSEKGVSILHAARQVYEEVKGEKYREEQATAKLLEFLNLQNEIVLRKKEITGTFPGLAHLITEDSSNDDKYLLAA